MRDEFLEQGYLIVRNIVRADELDTLREAFEILVEYQKEIWVRDREPDEPLGGRWESHRQPRLQIHQPPLVHKIDERTAPAVEIWLHEKMYGLSTQLIGNESTALTEMMLMCSPQKDHGPAKWHRDMYPPYTAHLKGYIDDILESGPRYVQWNLSLYDDDVLWVVPGSHLRPCTEEENTQLLKDPYAPLLGGVQTHLKAGDGVVYITPLLHWGSNYSPQLRRCVHGGFSPYASYEEPGYIQHLSTEAQTTFARWIRHSEVMKDHTEAALRGALDKDGSAYHTALELLKPDCGESGKTLSTVFLSKTAERIYNLKRQDFDSLPTRQQELAADPHPPTLDWGRTFGSRFSTKETHALWDRFKPFDAAIQSDEEQFWSSFQSPNPSRYYFNEIPAHVTVDGFIDGWGA